MAYVFQGFERWMGSEFHPHNHRRLPLDWNIRIPKGHTHKKAPSFFRGRLKNLSEGSKKFHQWPCAPFWNYTTSQRKGTGSEEKFRTPPRWLKLDLDESCSCKHTASIFRRYVKLLSSFEEVHREGFWQGWVVTQVISSLHCNSLNF